MGTKRMSDEELHTNVDTFTKFLDEAGYASAVIVTSKTPETKADGESQQCAVLNANHVKGDVVATLLDGMEMLKMSIMEDRKAKLPPELQGFLNMLKGIKGGDQCQH